MEDCSHCDQSVRILGKSKEPVKCRYCQTGFQVSHDGLKCIGKSHFRNIIINESLKKYQVHYLLFD